MFEIFDDKMKIFSFCFFMKKMEMKVILARLLQTFNFEWLPEQSTKITEETTMKLADGALHYIRLLDGVTVDE